jgi:ribosomal protein L37AE/L43A
MENNKEVLPMGLDEIYANTLMESGEIINEERFLSDEDIENSYKDFKIRQFKWNDPVKKTSGFVDIEFPGREDMVNSFIIYDDGGVAFDNWMPEFVYWEIINYIIKQRKQKNNKKEISEGSNWSRKMNKKGEKLCPDCGEPIWDESKGHKLNKCHNCGLAFDNPEEPDEYDLQESKKSPLKESVTAYNGIYLSVIPERGGLKLSLTESGKEFAEENGLSEINFWEIFDDIEGNSEYIYVANLGEEGFGLTDAPGIIWGYEIGEDGELIETPDSELFYYNNYMLDDFGVKLAKNGSVIFMGEPKRNNIDESNDDIFNNFNFSTYIKRDNTGVNDKFGSKFKINNVDEKNNKVSFYSEKTGKHYIWTIPEFKMRFKKIEKSSKIDEKAKDESGWEKSEKFQFASDAKKFQDKKRKEGFKNLIKYRVTVKHDNGKIRLTVPATSEEKAKKIVMDYENCPECAIVKVERITESLDEKSDPLYKNHKGLYKTSINGFKVFEYNGKFIVYFNVGKKEHAFNWNGGSRSWEYLKNKLENITPEQALSDKELM